MCLKKSLRHTNKSTGQLNKQMMNNALETEKIHFAIFGIMIES